MIVIALSLVKREGCKMRNTKHWYSFCTHCTLWDLPLVARMAQDWLAIPGTIVDMEQMLSLAADLVVKKWGRLNSNTIRSVMCLKLWLDSGMYDIVNFWQSKRVAKYYCIGNTNALQY